MSTYKSIRPVGSETVALDKELSQWPRKDFWRALLVAFLSVGLSTWVWMNNDDIIAWGMSQGMVSEGSTGTLLGAVRRAAIVATVLGLGAAGLTMRPVRLGVTKTLGNQVRMVSAASQAAASALHGLWLAIVAVQAYVLRALSRAATAVVTPLSLLWRGFVAIGRATAIPLKYLWLGTSAIVGVAVLVLVLTWLGAVLVAQMVGLALVALGTGLANVMAVAASAVAQAIALALSYVGRVATAGLGYIRLAVTPIARAVAVAAAVVWHRATAMTLLVTLALVKLGSSARTVLGRGASAIASVVATSLGYLWMVATAVAKAATLVLGVFWLGTVIVARAATRALVLTALTIAGGVVVLLRYALRAVAVLARAVRLVLGNLWLGFVATARAVALLLGYLWRGVLVVAQAIGLMLGYVWISLVATARVVGVTLGYVWLGVVASVRVVGLMLRYGWLGAVAVSRPVARIVALALGYLWFGVVTVARALAQVLGYLWRGVAAVARVVALLLGYVWRSVVVIARLVARILGYLWLRVVARVVALLLWFAATVLAKVVALMLKYFWFGVVVIARVVARILTYLWLGVVAVSRAVALMLGRVWRGVAVIARVMARTLDRVWVGAVAFARALTLRLGYVVTVVERAVSLVMGNVRLGVAASSKAIALMLAYGRGAVAAVASAVASAMLLTIYVALRYTLSGLYIALTYLGLGVATGALVGARAARYAWMPVTAVLGYIGVSLATMARALFRLLRLVVATLGSPLLVGTTIIHRYMWLGVSRIALAAGWMAGNLGIGTAMILALLTRTPGFLLRAAWTGFSTSPDVLRATVWTIRRKKGGTTMSDFNLSRERLLPFVMTVLVFFTIGAAAVRVLWPAPPEPTVEVVHWATGHLFRDGLLPNMAAEFNERGHRSKSGKRIVVKVVNDPSSLQADDLLSRVTGGGRQEAVCCPASDTPHPDPTIVTPSSAHWLVRVNHEAGRKVVDPDAARPIARAYIGIITYRDMAECLGWPDKEIGYRDILELRRDPRGWTKYDCAKRSWGTQPLVAFTDPKTSSTGRSVLLAFYSIAAGKQPEDLTSDDVGDPDVIDSVKEFQGLIDHYFIGTTVMNTKIYQGPRFGQFFIMPEDNLIHLYEGTERAFFGGKKRKAPPISDPMVMIYPKEGSMARNNCACIVSAPWVTPEHVAGAEKWIDFIREDEQQRAFMRAGFRPVTDLPLTDPNSKISSEYGLTPSTPKKQMDVALIDPAVADAIDESWETVKRPGIVTFVVDTSGSMLGDKLKQAKDGLIRALDSMAENNQVGFVSFDDTINTHIPVAPIAESGFAIADTVDKLRARGETALYDAVKTGIEMTDAAEGDAEAIRGVVVLTDGRANRCRVRLHDLIQMESGKNEAKIRTFGGCENDPPAVDEVGRAVEKADMIGARPAIDTVHEIQVFFIGIGEDADLDVGRMLAEATGAEFQGVSEDDLANVLAEFSGYF